MELEMVMVGEGNGEGEGEGIYISAFAEVVVGRIKSALGNLFVVLKVVYCLLETCRSGGCRRVWLWSCVSISTTPGYDKSSFHFTAAGDRSQKEIETSVSSKMAILQSQAGYLSILR